MFTTTSSRPSPRIPLELLDCVLRLCDPPTLAVAGKVSLALLQLSSPILHKDISITLERIELLLCDRPPTLDSPQLRSSLDLQRVRSLTISATYLTGGTIHLSPARLPTSISPTTPVAIVRSPTLPVALLTLHPIGINPCDVDDIDEERSRWQDVLRVLDPKNVHVEGLRNGSFNAGQVPRLHFVHHPWPNLTSLTLTNVQVPYFPECWVKSSTPLSLTFDASDARRWGDARLGLLLLQLAARVVSRACNLPIEKGRLVVIVDLKEEEKTLRADIAASWGRSVHRHDRVMREVRVELREGQAV